VKILSKRESDLTQDEAEAVRRFRTPRVDIEEPAHEVSTLANELLRANRRRSDDAPSEYADLRFILPTSNVVERLLSVAKYILTYSRKHMHPINFETVIFLRTNRSYWDCDTVAKSIE